MRLRIILNPRLIFFAAAVLALALLLLVPASAWLYIFALTHPGCYEPSPIAGFPAPRTVSLDSADGVRVRAWYYPTHNGAAILALGGMDGALGNRLPPVGFLLEAGYGVLQVDTRACAEPSAPVTLGPLEALDAAAALEFLQSQPEVEQIGAFGFSMGAAAALQAAARHPEIGAVIAEGGYFNLGDDIIEAGRPLNPLHRLFLYTVAAAYRLHTGIDPWESSPIQALPSITPRPVFLIYGESETESGRIWDQYAAAAEPKEFWVVPGGGHGANYTVAASQYRQRVLDFYNRWLK